MLDYGHMNDTNCIFCKIIAGEIPADKVYEDADTVVMLDIKPINPGHLLVMPKEHHVNAYDLPSELIASMMKVAQKMALAQQKALGVENVNVYMNNGSAAGQMVFHAHIHVIPRHENDGYGLWHGKAYEDGRAKEVADKIKTALA